MFRFLFLTAVFCLSVGIATVGAGVGDNLCHSTMAGSCYNDIEWEIGWFWAHYSPSVANCATYHSVFGGMIGDIWGFCNEYGMPDPDSPTNSNAPNNVPDQTQASGASGDGIPLNEYGVVLNTSYGSGRCDLPPEGVEDDYSYDTSSCQTSF